MKTKLHAAVTLAAASYAVAWSAGVPAGPAPADGPGAGGMPMVVAQARSGASGARSGASAPISPLGDNRYGSPAGDMPYDREVRLTAATRGVNVARLETIRFVTQDGREFRWTFDTFRRFEVFPLSDIAPANVAVPAGATVYVNGDIPIAP